MECCCHVCAGAPRCYSVMLDKLRKWVCRTVGPTLAASLETLGHRRSVASLSLFYRFYSSRSSSELPELVPLPDSHRMFTRYFNRLHYFSVTSLNSFSPRKSRLWNPLPVECFPLTNVLNRFESRVNRHLLPLDSF